MRCLPPGIRNALIVAPHSDDEAIGAFALMQALRRRGCRLQVVVVSDGAASHPGSLSWPPARLVAERRRETLRAMRAIGIPPSRIGFLGLPDGALSDDEAGLGRAIGRRVRRMPCPDLIVGPVGTDAHGDHCAVARAIARQRARHRLGYQVWPLGTRQSGGLRVALDGRSRAIKRRVVRSYRTQAGLITDATDGMLMRPHHLRSFAGPAEWFEVLA